MQEEHLERCGSLSAYKQGVTVVTTGGWDTARLPISANNYFAIGCPLTDTPDHASVTSAYPVTVQSVATNSVTFCFGTGVKWRASILIIGTV